MTAQEWASWPSPQELLRGLGRDRLATGRKLRLFACACCRRVWDRITESESRQAVLVAERFADGLASVHELHAAAQAATAIPGLAACAAAYTGTRSSYHAARQVMDLTAQVVSHSPERMFDGTRFQEECRYQTALLHDLFDNCFMSCQIDSAWLQWDSGAVEHLARTVYDERRFSALPLLADALEEAGCTDAHILRHCRDSKEHVRGCWVLDALLGFE